MVHSIGQRESLTWTVHVQASNFKTLQNMALGDTALQVRTLGT